MTEPLADRLKRLSEQHDKEKQADADVANFQKRVDAFISDRSRPEYERLLTILERRIAEVNPQIGPLPQFRFIRNGQEIEQGNATAYLHFDKPILNAPHNALMISFGPNRDAMYFFEPPPEPERYRLQAAASNSLETIVWTGDLGELTSEKLVDFIIEQLTTYYLRIKPK